MIWGMTLEPGKLYTEIMGEEVQLSMAAIDSRKDLGESPNNSFCQIVMKTSKGEYVLCTLIHGVMFQQTLDLKLMPREKVTFSVQGPSIVYLVGYTASYPEDEDLDLEDAELEDTADSSAWEALESEDSAQLEHIKMEPIEVPEEDCETIVEEAQQEGDGGVPREQPDQLPTEMKEDSGQEEREEEEIIFSVADLESDVKTEAPTPKPDMTMPPQLTPQDNLYGMQTSDDRTALPQTSPNSEFFYPETQQQPDIPLTPPVSYQPPNSVTGYPQQSPQGVVPAPEQFLPPQKTFVQQRPQAGGPVRHQMGSGHLQPMNTQRNYPPSRRQYGTNRNQPTAKSRSATQPMNVQQVRNVSNIQSMPGPSPQDVPGPSTSGFYGLLDPINHQNLSKSLGTNPNEDGATYAHLLNPTGTSSSLTVKSHAGLPTTVASHGRRFHTNPSKVSGIGYRAKSKLTTEHFPSSLPAFCRFCAKKFSDLAKLRSHEVNHAKADRYSCKYCGKTFYKKGNLTNHERVHTGEKPFKCRFCDKRFTQITNCRTHEGKVHSSSS